ncbi:MAG: hypothetical protein JKY84_03005 [Emcibacteraceae bacterium]|nr:hypothetical protein [Emcibacteraceae bacterium]
MKRFYKLVTVSEEDGKFSVLLDGKKIKTPEKRPCLMPTREMAEAVSTEWNDQKDEVKPWSMPITKLMNTAIDRVGSRRDTLIDELVGFAGSDQICYRADQPEALMTLQNKSWNPLLQWMKDTHGVALEQTTGIVFVEQDAEALLKIRALIENIESFALTAFYGMVTVTGSVTIGLGVFQGHLTIEQAWEAGHLDENFQISQWGSDYEAEDRREGLKSELKNAAIFLTFC